MCVSKQFGLEIFLPSSFPIFSNSEKLKFFFLLKNIAQERKKETEAHNKFETKTNLLVVKIPSVSEVSNHPIYENKTLLTKTKNLAKALETQQYVSAISNTNSVVDRTYNMLTKEPRKLSLKKTGYLTNETTTLSKAILQQEIP